MKRLNKGKKTLKSRTLKKKNTKALKKLALAIAITIISAFLYTLVANHTQEAKQRIQLENTSQQLNNVKKELQQKQTQSDEDRKKLDEVNKQLEETKKALEAKRNTATVYAAEQTYPIPAGDAKAFIYAHESGNNPKSVNSIGCRGLGQACPGSKLPCGDDYACQDAWFTNYMKERYGTWENARYFWIQNHWW